jgi:hypothetical protein
MATGSLASLSNLICKKNYMNSSAQAAVWAISDGSSIADIYGEDTSMVNELLRFVSKETGVPMPKKIIPKEHYIYAIKINLMYHFSIPTKVTLACYDENGNVVKEYYKNRQIPTGLYLASFGINKVADKGTKYIYRMTDENGLVLRERIITESIIEAKPEKWQLSVSIEYVLENPASNVTMSLFDEQGNLLETLYSQRSYPAGGRRQSYSFYHAFGKETYFYLRLIDKSGKIIMERKISAEKSVLIPN